MPLIAWKHSCKQVLRNLVILNRFWECLPMECMLLEQGQNRMDREWIWKRYGMGMEWIWNIQNGQRVGTGTKWYGNRMQSLKHSLAVRFLLIGIVTTSIFNSVWRVLSLDFESAPKKNNWTWQNEKQRQNVLMKNESPLIYCWNCTNALKKKQ